MEIFTLLEEIENIIEKAKINKITNRTTLSREEAQAVLEMIADIRLKFPDELKQARWIREERDRIIEEAKRDAENIVKEAENRIISMIDEHEITKKAYEQKAEIIIIFD